jgi:translocation and assembly module TamB
MPRRRRIAIYAGAGVALVLLLLFAALLVITNTDWGRERVRRVMLDQLAGATDANIHIGRVEGNLLRRITLVDVRIDDEQARPFLRADTIATRFSLRGLLRQRIALTDVRVVRGLVVLDEPPGDDWNYVRIFRIDPEERPPDPALGWGDWISLHNVGLVDTRIVIRSAWAPPEDITPAERERAIERALGGEMRDNIVAVEGGYQNIMDFRRLDATLPVVIPAHPDSAGIPIEISRFTGVVQPFRPPAARVEALAGRFRLERDTLHFSDVRAELPDSRLAAAGLYALSSGDLLLSMNAAPVAFADMRWLYPQLPESGGGDARLTILARALATRIIAEDMDLSVGAATLEGRIDVTTGDTLRLDDTDVRFARVGTALITRVMPDFDFPRTGEFTGRLAVSGPRHALAIDGDVAFDDDAGPTSRVVAVGELGVQPQLRFGAMRMEFRPLHAQLLRAFVPAVPLRGVITGYANLTGTTDLLQLQSDLTLDEPGAGRSRVLASGRIDQRQDLRLDNVVVRMDPLRTDLLRDAMPQLPAGGTLVGSVRLDGQPARALQLDGAVVLTDPRTGASSIGARGGIEFADELRLRNMFVRVDPLQLDLVRPYMPDLPAGGTLAGEMLLDGVPARQLRVDGDVELRDPQSGVSEFGATGSIAWADELRLDDLALRLHRVQLDLLRPWLPDLPAGATVAGALRLDGVPARALHVDGDVAVNDPQSGVSEFGATGRIAWADELRFDGLNVRLHSVQLDLLRQHFLPELPPGGTVAGNVALTGVPSRMLDIDGNLTHVDPRLGTSRFGLTGGIAFGETMRFRSLDVRMDPLQLALVRGFVPELPLGGVIAGRATIDGSPQHFTARGNVVHNEAGRRSHVAGSVELVTGPGGWAMADVRLQPLSLATVGRFVPAAGLHGSVAGTLRARGSMDDLRLNADLRVAGGGSIAIEGWLNAAAAEPAYDLRMQADAFNIAAVTTRAPAVTALTGRMAAAGRGTDPATMSARVEADLVDLRVDDVAADRLLIDARIDAGLATFDTGFVRLGTAEAQVQGSFGLVAGRHGELAYTVRADSLHAFAGAVPGTESGVEPVPTYALLAADTLVVDTAAFAVTPPAAPGPPAAGASRFAGGTREGNTLTVADISAMIREPEQLAADTVTGAMPAGRQLAVPGLPRPRTPGDTLALPPVRTVVGYEAPADSLAGRLFAEGVIRGNIQQFDAEGRAEVEGLVFRGAEVAAGEVEYTLRDVRTPVADIDVDASLHGVRVAGVAFDSLSVDAEYRGDRFGEGRAVIVAHQDEDTDYRADLAFTLSLQESELRLADAAFRFDTINWQSTRPGVIRWAGGALEVETLEFASDAGGSIFVDGTLPVEGAGDFNVRIHDLQLAQIATLLQLDEELEGILDLDARVTGTQANPVIAGTGSLTDARRNGAELPDVRTTLDYADRSLTADAELFHDGRLLATADARLPVDLSITGAGPRLLDGPIAVNIRADSLPADMMPAFTDQVEDVQGRLTGEIAIRGTFSQPLLEGQAHLDLGTARIVPLGVRFDEIAASLTLDGSTITVDSLVAWSGGPARVTGEISIADPADPVFDLVLAAHNSRVINTDDAELRLDADITVTGPLSALAIAGDIHARSGVIYIPEAAELGGTNVVNLDDPGTFDRMGGAFEGLRRRRDTGPAILENATVDVAIVIDRDVWLRSTEANVEIYTPPDVGPLLVQANGIGGNVVIRGSINTDRGDYEFMGRRFRMTRGAITFVGESPINPMLQIAAEHEVRLPGREALQIRIVIGGTVDDLELSLESGAQPPISQTDLLSFLAFGRDASSLIQQQGSGLSGQGGVAGELVGNLAGMATQQLATVALEAGVSEIEREVARELGLDMFRISPADLPAEVFTGGYADVFRATEIEAGRYLRPRLFLAAQTRAARPGLRLEYRTRAGYEWHAAWQPRYRPVEPTLLDVSPDLRSVFGSFIFREWRF